MGESKDKPVIGAESVDEDDDSFLVSVLSDPILVTVILVALAIAFVMARSVLHVLAFVFIIALFMFIVYKITKHKEM